MVDKRQEVSRYERDYIHDAKMVNESHQQCLSFEKTIRQQGAFNTNQPSTPSQNLDIS
jgi:hypothetical protein